MLLLDRTLLKLAKGSWGWIAAIVAVRFLSLVGIAGFSAAIGGFLGTMTDPGLTLADAGGAIRAAALTALLTFAAQLAQGELEFRCAAKTRNRLRKRIFSRVLDLDVGHIERIGPVSAITASVDAVEQVQLYYSAYLPTLIFSLIAPIYLFLRLRNTSVLVASMLLAVSIMLEPVNNLFRGRIEKLRRVYWHSVEAMTAYYLDIVRGLSTLKLFNRADSAAETLSQKAERLNRDINRFMRVNFTSNLVTEAMIYLSIVAALVLTGRDLAAGKTDLGSALTVLMLSYSYFNAIRQLMGATHTALTAVSAATGLEDIEAVDASRPFDPSLPVEESAFPGIRAENVSFSYEQRGAALKGVSLEIERGKTTALAGLSGCGKSTMAALLMRFSDPDAGRILLDGRDYRAMTSEQLRRHIVMVPQSVSIFSGTLRDNLLLARPNAADGELLEALREVRLADWVRSLANGLDEDVGDAGSKLSGGQRQKIGIARALLSNAETIIFDEATSSVDPDSEREIWACIHRLALTRTLVVISHRLSTIREADRIYVLENGGVAEWGTHRELMGRNGLYRRMVLEQEALEGGAA